VDAARDAIGEVGLLAVREGVMRLVDARDRDDAGELVRERLDAIRSECFELLAPVVHRRDPNPLRSS
jgi:hypothetical protein